MSFSKPIFAPAAIALAVAISSASSIASAQVAVPGLNSPISAAADTQSATTPQNTPDVEKASTSQPPAATPRNAGAAPANPGRAPRAVMVSPETANLPAVPASVIPVQQRTARPSQPVETRQDVVVSNGTNTLIPISRGQINRIVTPFENPTIQTVSQAEISTRDNVVYVTTQDEQPVTMFITPEDDEGVAISLTLFPQAIPPIQANLLFTQSVPGSTAPAGVSGAAGLSSQGYSGQARRWERSQPFVDTLRGIMRELALGNLPRGYSFADLQSGDSIPDCFQQGVNFDFSKAQYILGHEFRVFIAVAENNTAQHLEVSHSACTHPNRAAAAIWPNEILEPGQKTEVFLVTRVPQVRANTSTRPSLLN